MEPRRSIILKSVRRRSWRQGAGALWPILGTRHTGRANIGSSQSVNDDFDGDSPGLRTSLMPSVGHVHSEWELEIFA